MNPKRRMLTTPQAMHIIVSRAMTVNVMGVETMRAVRVTCDHCAKRIDASPVELELTWPGQGKRHIDLCAHCVSCFFEWLDSKRAVTLPLEDSV